MQPASVLAASPIGIYLGFRPSLSRQPQLRKTSSRAARQVDKPVLFATALTGGEGGRAGGAGLRWRGGGGRAHGGEEGAHENQQDGHAGGCRLQAAVEVGVH